MAKPYPSLYTAEISLVLALVFLVNSLLLFFDHFLSSFLAMTAALSATTLCFIACTHFAKTSESFQTIYWSSFSLMSANLSTAGDSTTWDLQRGYLLTAIGFTGLVLYTMYVWCWSSSNQQDQVPEKPAALPLPLELTSQFIGNGIAIMGRCFIPGGSLVWILVGSAVMLSISALCSYNYCKTTSVSLRNHSQQLHTD